MRKLYVFNMVTLDGYFEGPNREIDWHKVDEEFNEFAIQEIDTRDLLLFGRVTYELMASYWPTSDAVKNDPIVANDDEFDPQDRIFQNAEKSRVEQYAAGQGKRRSRDLEAQTATGERDRYIRKL